MSGGRTEVAQGGLEKVPAVACLPRRRDPLKAEQGGGGATDNNVGVLCHLPGPRCRPIMGWGRFLRR